MKITLEVSLKITRDISRLNYAIPDLQVELLAPLTQNVTVLGDRAFKEVVRGRLWDGL